jgi:DNA-binding winged helix-turn-helix (wHTH) protein/TolB-like protein
MIYAFGTFVFESGSLELTREGRRVALEPQPARGLARLLAGAGELVTRDEMREAIWGSDTHVDYDRGLAYCVGQIRAALGDRGENPRFVQTLPKRGYRFVAPVSAQSPTLAPMPVPNPAPAPAPMAMPEPGRAPARHSRRWLLASTAAGVVLAGGWWWQQSGAGRTPTVAVSIFDNETGDPAHDGFVQGLSDVVVTRLTALAPGRVGVIGNAAPLRQPRNIRNLKTLAATLEADYLVLGQLQRQDADLRFIVHFIRLRDEVHLSAQRFIRPPGEVARFEGDVVTEADRVVRAFVIDPAGS